MYPLYSGGFQALSNLTVCVFAVTNQVSAAGRSEPIGIE